MYTVAVHSLKDIFTVRSIRNSCCQFMTRDTRKIGIIEQLLWAIRYQKNKYFNIWCYLAVDERKTVGYTLVRRIDGKFWISGGLVPQARGRGLGKNLF